MISHELLNITVGCLPILYKHEYRFSVGQTIFRNHPPRYHYSWQVLQLSVNQLVQQVYEGSLGIAPTRNCTHFLKIVVAGGGFHSSYIHQGYKSDKEKIFFLKLRFMHTKRLNTFFNRWVQFSVGAVPRLPYISLNRVISSDFIIE